MIDAAASSGAWQIHFTLMLHLTWVWCFDTSWMDGHEIPYMDNQDQQIYQKLLCEQWHGSVRCDESLMQRYNREMQWECHLYQPCEVSEDLLLKTRHAWRVQDSITPNPDRSIENEVAWSVDKAPILLKYVGLGKCRSNVCLDQSPYNLTSFFLLHPSFPVRFFRGFCQWNQRSTGTSWHNRDPGLQTTSDSPLAWHSVVSQPSSNQEPSICNVHTLMRN